MLPDIRTNPERESIHQAREQERKEKARLKMYKGGKSNVKKGETILMERKTTKANSPFDSQPFTAVQLGTAGQHGVPKHKSPSPLQGRD